ncbi:ciliogenesis and planar polarity effector 1-like [Polypterus senegalus]|uniref:ciliogenesis and planar polarity effector 1-like n=1 Tax=Polypterus senegalus TaxID=55291 RepID=UPI001963DDD0|nr:ciliogenesis and planar polarity effector 1-like [Polypterus senegalus]
MEVKLEVIVSSSIKRKKPWSRFSWLGQTTESIFMLDDKRISEINIVTGRKKKKSPKFSALLKNVINLATSTNGAWLIGLLVSGELFLWNKDHDCLKMTSAADGVSQVMKPSHESELKSFDCEDAFGSEVSLKDDMRQRFSVNAHWRLPYLIVSDGYMVTVLNISSNFLPSNFMSSILEDTRQRLKKIKQTLLLSQPQNREKLKQLSSLNLSSVQDEEFKAPAVESTPQFIQEDYEAQEEKNNDPHTVVTTNLTTNGAVTKAITVISAQTILGPLLAKGAWDECSSFNSLSLPLTSSMIQCSGDESNEDSLSLCDFAPEVLSGRIEFASMFDTIHAITDLKAESSDTSAQIPLIQKNLLMSGITSPQALANALFVLKLTSQHLNVIYTAQSQLASNGARLDMFSTPFLQEGLDLEKSINFSVVAPQQVDTQQKPSDRLAAVWKTLYQQALRYQSFLHKSLVSDGQQPDDTKHEECWSSRLIAQIQTAIQTSGMSLGGMKKLNSIRGGGRTHFLQTRYCLSILYCHLYHYNLRAAHGLCDRLARWVLHHSRLYSEDVHTLADECCFHERWPLCNINNEAACAVIQSMARFMVAYFTNRPLFVLPPHHVDILPPLQGKPDCLPRVIPLQHSYLAKIVRDQHLSSVWTVEYALDLLLIGGLLPEAVWFAHTLGDWKMAVSLGLAYNFYCQTTFNLPRLKLRELEIPSQLQPTQIFKNKLQSLIGQKSNPEGLITAGADPRSGDVKSCKRFTDSIEEEDADSLFNSIQEILKAAVMAESDVLSETFIVVLQTAKELSTKLTAIVPHGLYLPAPPLYCPQPALDVKIQLKGSQPLLSPFPESLLKYLNTRNYLQARGPNRGGQPDPVVLRTIHCFRELCGLCWMFHVREMLSVNCRKYQLARNTGKDLQEIEEYNAAAIRYCIEALEWACRFLPFARFINAEEVVQDVILSLLAELPPIKMVADILVKAFPEQQESVRVALREKYSSLLKNLRHLTVKGQFCSSVGPNPIR